MVRSVSILGNGGRENAIKSLLQKQDVEVHTHLVKESFIDDDSVDFGIACMEDYLAEGISEQMKVPFFGPTKEMALIESSKIYSKTFMIENEIPTAESQTIYHKEDADEFLMVATNIVIKADGLCKGKGVFLPDHTFTRDELPDPPFLIESRLQGTEVSVMGFCNGHDIELMPQVKDYKRIGDCDNGENTGGMGAIGPVEILTHAETDLVRRHMKKVVEKLKFVGVLYAGLMKTDYGVYFLEFNARFGDPETQIVCTVLESDLYTVMKNCIEGKRNSLLWSRQKSVGVVLSHYLYPSQKLDNPVKIDQISELSDGVSIFWSGDGLETKGGRVGTVVATADDLEKSRRLVYNNIHKIKYDGRYYRRDICLDYPARNSGIERFRKVAVMCSGNGTSIDYLLKQGLVEVIVTNTARENLYEKAKKYKVKIFYFPKIDYVELINFLDAFKIDLILAVGFMSIIPTFFCEYFDNKLFNIHPSLLPDHGKLMDLEVHKSVQKAGDLYGGCTIHKITEDVDGGEIYLQKQFKIPQFISEPEDLKRLIQGLEKKTLYDFVKLMGRERLDYASSGVDVQKGDEFVEGLKEHLPEETGSFCAIIKSGKHATGFACDGVGTKLELAREHNKLFGIGTDLVAMSVNDLLVRGVKPLFFMDYIALSKMDLGLTNTILDSIRKTCKKYDIQLVGGETAEMPGVYKYGGFDLAGFATGILVDEIENLFWLIRNTNLDMINTEN